MHLSCALLVAPILQDSSASCCKMFMLNQYGAWKCPVCVCTDFCSPFTSCHDLSGNTSSPPETAPNAEARCAQQAVRLLSEYLSGCHRQSNAHKSTSASIHVVSSACGNEDTRRLSEAAMPKQKQVSCQAESGLSSHSVPSASGAAECRVDEQQCSVMWAEACDEHFLQVRLFPPTQKIPQCCLVVEVGTSLSELTLLADSMRPRAPALAPSPILLI